MDVVQQYATANGFVMVLDVSNPQTPVLWHNPATDITSDIIKLYDQAHPPATAAKPAAPAPPAAKK
jgi:outer membrane protein